MKIIKTSNKDLKRKIVISRYLAKTYLISSFVALFLTLLTNMVLFGTYTIVFLIIGVTFGINSEIYKNRLEMRGL